MLTNLILFSGFAGITVLMSFGAGIKKNEVNHTSEHFPVFTVIWRIFTIPFLYSQPIFTCSVIIPLP